MFNLEKIVCLKISSYRQVDLMVTDSICLNINTSVKFLMTELLLYLLNYEKFSN